MEAAYGGEWTFPGLDVAAKTGTAEVGDGTSHAWMTGFFERPAAHIRLRCALETRPAAASNAGPGANAVLQAAVG